MPTNMLCIERRKTHSRPHDRALAIIIQRNTPLDRRACELYGVYVVGGRTGDPVSCIAHKYPHGCEHARFYLTINMTSLFGG